MAGDDARGKSKSRFKQINHLVDNVFRTLKTPTHALVMVVAWRDADAKGRFSMSYSQIAKVVGVSRRHAYEMVQDLIKSDHLKVIRDATGRRPPVYKINFQVPVELNCGSTQINTHHPEVC